MTPERRAALVDSLMDAIEVYIGHRIDIALDAESEGVVTQQSADVLHSAIFDLVEELE